jgi:hypothetical protein
VWSEHDVRRRELADQCRSGCGKAVSRVRFQRGTSDGEDFADVGGVQLCRGRGRVCVAAEDGHRHRLPGRLRGGNGFPRRPVQGSVLLFRDDQ